jgi:hypothetical protein
MFNPSVRDALAAKADFYARIGDKVTSEFLRYILLLHEFKYRIIFDHSVLQTNALAAYDLAMAKTIGVGPRIDLSFSVLLVALFFTDVELLKKKLDETKKYALQMFVVEKFGALIHDRRFYWCLLVLGFNLLRLKFEPSVFPLFSRFQNVHFHIA